MENGKKKQSTGVLEVDSLTEADVRRIVRQEMESCKIEDLEKRVKELEETGGPCGV